MIAKRSLCIYYAVSINKCIISQIKAGLKDNYGCLEFGIHLLSEASICGIIDFGYRIHFVESADN